MLWLFYLLALLACSYGQSTNICSQATVTINSQADATALASCSIVSGAVFVSSTATGVISIDGPQILSSHLVCQNAGGLTSLSSTTITSIGGTFMLTNLTLLSTLGMQALTAVNSISWTALPALSDLTFPATVTSISTLSISNTFLNSLDGLDPVNIKSADINNNNRLKTFSSQLSTISGVLNVASNGNSFQLSFPDLIWALNMTISNVSALNVPVLSTVNNSFTLSGNSFPDFSAKSLSSVGNVATGTGSLSLISNPTLTNITLPNLKNVGGALQVANNTALQSFSFPSLANVGGAISLTGNFTTPSLPALVNVKGGFNLQSTASVDCSLFQAERDIIQGSFTCKTSANTNDNPTTGNNTTTTSSGAPSPTPTNPSNSSNTSTSNTPSTSSTKTPANKKSSSLSSGAIAGIVIGVVLLLVIGALIIWAWKKGYKFTFGVTKREVDEGVPHPGMAELPRGGHHERTELSAATKPSELSAARLDGPVRETYELPGHER